MKNPENYYSIIPIEGRLRSSITDGIGLRVSITLYAHIFVIVQLENDSIIYIKPITGIDKEAYVSINRCADTHVNANTDRHTSANTNTHTQACERKHIQTCESRQVCETLVPGPRNNELQS